jgi:uncharacterized repeat protein (TIGR01451 family)
MKALGSLRFPARRRATTLVALLAALGLGFPASARDDLAAPAEAVTVTGSGRLEARIEVQKLVVEDGPDGKSARRFEPAGSLEVGEELHYTVRVTNPGREPVRDVVVTQRLPYGVDYVNGSAVGPACDVEVSWDGGVTFVRDQKRGQYTHVRWTLQLPLAPGSTALLRFRAIFR